MDYPAMLFDIAMETSSSAAIQQMAATARFLPGKIHHFFTGWLYSDRNNDAAFSAFGLETVCIFSTLFKIRAQHMENKFSWQFK